jgi:PPE-repeat protein
MDFAALPPEINSGRMYAGPGAGPMLAAAAAWDGLAADLHATAADYGSVISGLTSGPWLGPSSASMAAQAAAQVAWLTTTATEAEQAGAQAKAAAAAHAAAFAMTVPPPAIAANRAQLAALIATNILGQNTAAIAATEAHYAEMWAQDATAMYGYAAASQAATSQVTPFTPLQQTTNPAGLAGQGAAVAQAVGTPAGHAQTILSTGQLMSAVPQALQALTSPSAATDPPALTGIISDILNFQLPPIFGSFATFFGATDFPGILGSIWATAGTSWGIAANAAAQAASAAAPAAAVSAVSGAPGEAGLGAGLVSASRPLDGTAVSAGVGRAALVGGMSVPQGWVTAAPASWGTAAPAIRLAAAEVPSSFVAAGGPGGLFGAMPLLCGAPLMTMTGRGMADSRDRRERVEAPTRVRVDPPQRSPGGPVTGNVAEVREVATLLRELATLHDSGILTDEELNEQKRRLLGN